METAVLIAIGTLMDTFTVVAWWWLAGVLLATIPVLLWWLYDYLRGWRRAR